MNENQRLKRIFAFRNYLRTLPVYLCVITSRQRDLIRTDLVRWQKIHRFDGGLFTALNWFLTEQRQFRNLLLHRLKNPYRDLGCWVRYGVARLLWKPMEGLQLLTPEIGGGLYIEHGFATIVGAQRIGSNCWINQQVTVGYKDGECPILEDNVHICCGAKVLGGITMHRGSCAGAGAVVIHDVPANAIAVGVPARIIDKKTKKKEGTPC